MGRVGFSARTRRYVVLLVRPRSGAGVDGATPRRRPACVILADLLGNCAIVFLICPLMRQKCAFRYFGPRPTMSKAIKTGRVSAERQPDGSYRIQPAELFRVYPPETRGNGLDRSEFVERETGNDNRLVGDEIAVLRERLALLTDERDREREQLTDQIEDLRRRRDAEAEARRIEGEERRKLTAVLTDQRAKPEPAAPKGFRGFLHRLAG
jgi:hypothetical protein